VVRRAISTKSSFPPRRQRLRIDLLEIFIRMKITPITVAFCILCIYIGLAPFPAIVANEGLGLYPRSQYKNPGGDSDWGLGNPTYI